MNTEDKQHCTSFQTAWATSKDKDATSAETFGTVEDDFGDGLVEVGNRLFSNIYDEVIRRVEENRKQSNHSMCMIHVAALITDNPDDGIIIGDATVSEVGRQSILMSAADASPEPSMAENPSIEDKILTT